MRALAAFVSLMMLASCTYTSRITTDPPGAHIYVDNVYKGTAPLELETDMGPVPSGMSITVEKDGYEKVHKAYARKSLHADYTMSWLLLSPLLGLGIYLYILQGRHFDPVYHFPMRKLDAGARQAD